MSYVDELANQLALDVIKAQQETGDDNLAQDIGAVIEAGSSTLHEAFMTAIRVYAAEERARDVLGKRLKAAGKGAGTA